MYISNARLQFLHPFLSQRKIVYEVENIKTITPPVCLQRKYSDTNGIMFLQINKSKKEGKDQESIQSSITPDPGYLSESDNDTIKTSQTRAKRSALSQQVTKRHQQTDVHESITKQDRINTNDPQKQQRLGTFSKNSLLEGLNQFFLCTNLTLSSDVDQDT